MPEPTNENKGGVEDLAGTIAPDATDIPAMIRDAPHPDQNRMHDLKKGDETVQVTTEQLVQMAQKGWNADSRTQQAAETAKENATAIAGWEDLKASLESDDPDAFRRAGLALGVPGDQVEDVVRRTFGDPDEDVLDEYNRELDENRTDQPSRSRTDSSRSGPVNVADLAPDLQRVLMLAEQTRIKEIVQNALDKDEELSYNIKNLSPEGRVAARALVDEKIRGRLPEFGGDFGDGTRILSEILPEIREHLKALSTPRSGPMGLGHAPGGDGDGAYPTKKPDHVSSTEGDAHDQYVGKLLEFHQAQAEQGQA